MYVTKRPKYPSESEKYFQLRQLDAVVGKCENREMTMGPKYPSESEETGERKNILS